MLRRRWLPPDNFPDDTETYAFQNYEATSRPRKIRLSVGWRPTWTIAGLFTLAMAMFSAGIIAVFVWSEPREELIITSIPSQAPSLPQDPIGGDFPADAPQEFIRVPARIDNTLAAGGKRGYTFLARPGFTWEITLTTESRWQPILSVFDPAGVLIELSDNGQLILSISAEGTYAILLEDIANTGGSYTLTIFAQS